jgi:hypothetical protein
MSSVINEHQKEERKKAVELLRKQIETEVELAAQYKEYGEKIANLPVRRILHMIMFDSQKHIEILNAAIENIQGIEVLKEERTELREGLERHVMLEMESIKAAEKVLKYNWVRNTKGLNELLESWMDDEKRHHQTLKRLSMKSFIEANPNDWVTFFKGEEFLEERYLLSKRMQEKIRKNK